MWKRERDKGVNREPIKTVLLYNTNYAETITQTSKDMDHLKRGRFRYVTWGYTVEIERFGVSEIQSDPKYMKMPALYRIVQAQPLFAGYSLSSQSLPAALRSLFFLISRTRH